MSEIRLRDSVVVDLQGKMRALHCLQVGFLGRAGVGCIFSSLGDGITAMACRYNHWSECVG